MLLSIPAMLLTSPATEAGKPEAEQATDSNWPLFRGNSLSQGVASGTLLENPDLLWTFKGKE